MPPAADVEIALARVIAETGTEVPVGVVRFNAGSLTGDCMVPEPFKLALGDAIVARVPVDLALAVRIPVIVNIGSGRS